MPLFWISLKRRRTSLAVITLPPSSSVILATRSHLSASSSASTLALNLRMRVSCDLIRFQCQCRVEEEVLCGEDPVNALAARAEAKRECHPEYTPSGDS